MSSKHLQPSPFAPDQFLTRSDQDILFKKRPFPLTEDVEYFPSSRRPRRSLEHTPLDIPEFDLESYSAPPSMLHDPATPPKRPLPDSHDPERRRPSRRYVKNRRPQSLRRACSPPLSSPKFIRCDASPYHLRSRSPLTIWTPPPVASFPLYSLESSDVPPSTPVRPTSSSFLDHPFHASFNNINHSLPWTIPSPSSSPYPSHSPPSPSHSR